MWMVGGIQCDDIEYQFQDNGPKVAVVSSITPCIGKFSMARKFKPTVGAFPMKSGLPLRVMNDPLPFLMGCVLDQLVT